MGDRGGGVKRGPPLIIPSYVLCAAIFECEEIGERDVWGGESGVSFLECQIVAWRRHGFFFSLLTFRVNGQGGSSRSSTAVRVMEVLFVSQG